VFCEKPLVLSRDELEGVVSAAARAGRVLAVGFNRRFSPMLNELREFIAVADGSLSASYRVSAGRLGADHWTHDLDEGGGRLLGEGCHFIDSLTFLADSPVERVYAVGYGDPELPVQARDNVAIELRFSNGSIGMILYVSDGSARVPKERIAAFAGDRTAILDDYRTLELFEPAAKREAREKRQEKGHLQEVEAFLRAVERGVPPVPLRELANVSLATLAAVKSLRTARPIHLAQ
jgi:predicted dehydrogenase